MNERADTAALPRASYSGLDRVLRARVLAQLSGLRGQPLRLADAVGEVVLGEGVAGAMPLEVTVHDPGFYRAIARNGSVGAAEAYMDGLWDCSDLVGLVRLLVRHRDLLDRMESGTARLGGGVLRALHALRRNTRAGARRNIAAHYDLGNEFFALFLSPDLMYSSALFTDADDTLEAASTRKLEAICRKLRLQPGDRVVEIGSGWGGFAVHAAARHGCHVTTTTISREQHALACQRVAQAGLQDRVSVLLEDYRDLRGQYDKLVSIEMVEAIGAPYLDTYFERVAGLLKPDGLALLQAITIEDHRYERALHSVDFIKRHVFPGSFIPSINALLAAKTRSCDLALLQLEDFGASYARTLQAWRERFMANLPAVRAQSFDARFVRLWEFYLAYCEGGFRERAIGVAHLLFARPGQREAGQLLDAAGPRSIEA
ncbi:SAM-dependent methyltransferase [Lysobacter solisilvae (ex Woo and Kim 2020)]|uniref:Class I SAM-dependent methyltransferase n=1 Tax=Agrilutibacter terrestris TaxID=2865112 RepID=A0A7H0G0E1_9GAMM|nr:cyclopropane-fatty-acyl-phospholipid synthase family protein [Lysobacter terrestris]QNP41757.1 class I SAM-dependent methyltransferase [Lysobacter terrestris]